MTFFIFVGSLIMAVIIWNIKKTRNKQGYSIKKLHKQWAEIVKQQEEFKKLKETIIDSQKLKMNIKEVKSSFIEKEQFIFILKDDNFLEKRNQDDWSLKRNAYLSDGDIHEMWLRKEEIQLYTKPDQLNLVGRTEKNEYVFSYINKGNYGDSISHIQISLHFYPTDVYPCCILRLKIDDGSKDQFGYPDKLYLEHRIYINSIVYRIILFEILNANRILFCSIDGNQKFIDIDFSHKQAFINEIKALFEYMTNNKGLTCDTTRGTEMYSHIENLMTSAGFPKGGGSVIQYYNIIMARLNQNIKPDKRMWELDKIKEIFIQMNKAFPVFTAAINKIGEL